ncbi:MAG: quinoprotein relay system zinc metallohydrolase 2, partial [Thiotrichales bacterium]|nr:quinoprotein relay system zinc metallohydrolase 2 [Thiotrichales bacterium]
MKILCKYIIPFLVYILTGYAIASDGSGTDFEISEVAEGVFVHEGVHVTFDDPQHDDIANIGFIVGEKCVAVVDTGGSVAIAQALQNKIKSITDKPVCYVINTHAHFDHVLGNVVFKSDNTEFVGHADLADAMAASRDFYINEFRDDLGKYANPEGIVIPAVLVQDTMELDLGNRTLELRAWPVAHSHTDLTVLEKKTNTMWLSDLLFIERIPALDGKLKGWLKVIGELEAESFATVVPGHGPVMKDWPAAIQAQKNYLMLLLE